MSNPTTLNKFHCKKCSTDFDSKNKTSATCPNCKKETQYRYKTCNDCGVDIIALPNSSYCTPCANARKASGAKSNMADVPAKILKGLPKETKDMVERNWWHRNELAKEIAETGKDVKKAREILADADYRYLHSPRITYSSIVEMEEF